MMFRNALLAAGIAAMPLAAQAQAVTGPYVSLGAGVNLMQDEHIKSLGGIATSSDMKIHLGPALVAAGGWGFGNGLRAEIEGSYRYNSIYGLNNAGVSPYTFGGHEQKYGAMFNVLYDFVGLTPMFQPYVGLGAGYQWVQEQNLHAAGGGVTATGSDQTKGSFAYQAILGAAVPIAAVPGLALTAEYRFMGLIGDRSYGVTLASGGTSVPTSVKFDDNYNHSFLIGVRYNFGQAPAPAPVQPAPTAVPAVQPARSYLVFFDWDKATLTDRARQIIKEAADNSTHMQYTRLEVNGYTDTSGTPQYNQGLSIRRAQAVAAELVRDGVPKAAISIQGFGETHLLVPTGPNVREPQNRRVEIIVR